MSFSDVIDWARDHPVAATLTGIFTAVAGSKLVQAFQHNPVAAGIGTAFGLATAAVVKKATDNNWVAAGAGIAGGFILPTATQRFLTDVAQRTVDIPNHTAEQVAAMVLTYAAVYTTANVIDKTGRGVNNVLGFIAGLYAYTYTAPIIHPIVEAIKNNLT
jgi:hypothetical protein